MEPEPRYITTATEWTPAQAFGVGIQRITGRCGSCGGKVSGTAPEGESIPIKHSEPVCEWWRAKYP